MLSNLPLFWFELEVVYALNRFWIVEWCVFWNYDRVIMEMVEIQGGLQDYVN